MIYTSIFNIRYEKFYFEACLSVNDAQGEQGVVEYGEKKGRLKNDLF